MGKKKKKRKQQSRKLKLFKARIKYPKHFSKADFYGSWHKIKANSVADAKTKILKGTTGLSKKRVQVRKA